MANGQKWHISDDGIARVCKARPGKCRYGGEHYPTESAANNVIQKRHRDKNNILPRVEASNTGNGEDRTSDTRGNRRKVIKRIVDPKVIARYEGFRNPSLHAQEGSISNRMKCVNLDAKRIAYYEIDKGHRNGPEVHCLKEDGTILIYNKHTGRFITVFLARPGQLDTYIEDDLVKESPNAVDRMYRCADVNVRTNANRINGEFFYTEDEVRVHNNLKQIELSK